MSSIKYIIYVIYNIKYNLLKNRMYIIKKQNESPFIIYY